MNLDRRLIASARIAALALGACVLAGFLGGAAVLGQAWLLSRIINGVFLAGQRLETLVPWLGGLLAVVAVRALLSYLGESAGNTAAVQVKEDLRSRMLRHLVASGPAFSEGERTGELSNTLTQGIEALDAYFSQYLPQLALAVLLPLTYLLVVLPIDPLSGLVLLLTGPLIPFFLFLIGSKSQALTGKQWAALGKMSAYFLDTLQGLTTLKILGRSREQVGRIARVSEQYRQTTLSVLRLTFLSALALELLSTIGTAIVAVQVGLRLLYGYLDFETAFFVLLLAPDFYLPLRNLGLRFHASMEGASAARRIFAILEQPVPAVAGRSEGRSIDLRQPFELRFEGVGYTYPGKGQPALEGVRFAVQAGQQVVLVGASGAGKSTVARLLLRFCEPGSGAILVNGVPLASIPVEAWREQVAWVGQQPHLFQGTLASNLRLGRPGASIEELRQAARAAHLADWAESLPQGYDTPVGEGGARLSGGQAQRLALARAFLRDAPLLILDEPTAHLDPEQERLFAESLARLRVGRTVVMIAHRLETASRADRIVVLEGGRVVESGTHTDLLALGGAYTRLVAAYQGEAT